EVAKILNFIKNLKLAIKAKVSYCLSKNLENTICLEIIYDTTIYIVSRTESQISEEIRSNSSKTGNSGDNEMIPIELDRTK
ncbi:30906_t:CDS:1, partial [Racocetra persica]